MDHNSDIRNRLFDQFTLTVLEQGWRNVSCANIAIETGVEIKLAFLEYRNRYAYVTELVRRIDRYMLDSYDAEMSDEPARERLFDVMMARFEAMQAHRPLIVALTKATRSDPLLSLHLMALSRLTADWFLDVARISPSGIGGIVRKKGALAAYARTFRVWLKDDSEDLSKTMAALDKLLKQGEAALRRAQKLACALPKMRRRCRSSSRSSNDMTQASSNSSENEARSVDDGALASVPS
ncbi:hypothetical protein [Cohaesibacter celericrescens]|uniref:hypothetical protein n=1 Tax=Cohaesibacter celericrescens TaxID=2067669 RepID=UPI00356279F4